jgi:heme-degrading monooxygenase HmoA
MEIYIATLYAKHGHEAEVTRFYQEMEPMLKAAKGFRGRQLLRAEPGAMFSVVKSYLSAEELASNREPPHAEGVHFVIIEHWDSRDDRVRFSRGQDKARTKSLIPHLLPQHTHEFYEDVSPA